MKNNSNANDENIYNDQKEMITRAATEAYFMVKK